MYKPNPNPKSFSDAIKAGITGRPTEYEPSRWLELSAKAEEQRTRLTSLSHDIQQGTPGQAITHIAQLVTISTDILEVSRKQLETAYLDSVRQAEQIRVLESSELSLRQLVSQTEADAAAARKQAKRNLSIALWSLGIAVAALLYPVVRDILTAAF